VVRAVVAELLGGSLCGS